MYHSVLVSFQSRETEEVEKIYFTSDGLQVRLTLLVSACLAQLCLHSLPVLGRFDPSSRVTPIWQG